MSNVGDFSCLLSDLLEYINCYNGVIQLNTLGNIAFSGYSIWHYLLVKCFQFLNKHSISSTFWWLDCASNWVILTPKGSHRWYHSIKLVIKVEGCHQGIFDWLLLRFIWILAPQSVKYTPMICHGKAMVEFLFAHQTRNWCYSSLALY